MAAELTVDESGSSVSASAEGRRRVRRVTAWVPVAPYLLYMTLLLIVPIVLIAWSAVRTGSGEPGFTLDNVRASFEGAYRTGLLNSIRLAAVTAAISAVLGLALAWAVLATGNATLMRLVSTSSAVLANFGGLPLAFLFVAVLGTAGVLTQALQATTGLSLQNDLQFSLYSLTGVQIVYLYFLVPLMVLVITPALESIKPQWREAAESLGATPRQYWVYVAMPVLLPQLLGSLMLLFCGGFSAFATASALTNGTLAITPLQIDTAISGNVLVAQGNLGSALALNMIAVVLPLTLIYQALHSRTSRWLQ